MTPPISTFFCSFDYFDLIFFAKVQNWSKYDISEKKILRRASRGVEPTRKLIFFRKFISMITQKVQLPLSQSFLRTAPRGKSKAFRRASELKTSFRLSKKKIAKLSFSRRKCSAIYFSKNRKKIPSSKAPLNASPPAPRNNPEKKTSPIEAKPVESSLI